MSLVADYQYGQQHKGKMLVNLHHDQSLFYAQENTKIDLTHVRHLELGQSLLWFQICHAHKDSHGYAYVKSLCHLHAFQNMTGLSDMKAAYLPCLESSIVCVWQTAGNYTMCVVKLIQDCIQDCLMHV